MVGMSTVYAGLWYLSGDLRYESKIFLFIIILFANAIFGIMWITEYLSYAEWAENLVKKYRIESQYIETQYYLPYFPEYTNDHVPLDKNQYLHYALQGKNLYTDEISQESMEKIMKNRDRIIYKLYQDTINSIVPEISNDDDSN